MRCPRTSAIATSAISLLVTVLLVFGSHVIMIWVGAASPSEGDQGGSLTNVSIYFFSMMEPPSSMTTPLVGENENENEKKTPPPKRETQV